MNKNIVKYILCGICLSINFFSNLYAENPYRGELFSQYSTFMKEHNCTAAKQEINKILSNYPDSPEMQIYGHFYLGFAEIGLYDYASAIPSFQYVIDHEPQFKIIEKNSDDFQDVISMDIYLMGHCYWGLKQYGDATIQYMKVIDNYSDSDNCFLAIGSGMASCYQYMGLENETVNMLLGISRKYSNHKVKFYALHHLAYYYDKKGDYDKALATCQQFLNELSLDKYPDLKDMKEKEIPALIQDINTQKSKKK